MDDKKSYMEGKEADKYLASEDLPLVEAMKCIDANSGGILYIVDRDSRLKGSLSDGDIRRWIIRTGRLQVNAGQIMFSGVKSLPEDEKHRADVIMAEADIPSIPIINGANQVIEIIFRESGRTIRQQDFTGLKDTSVIIMAGGKGTRLYPYTKILPKPLIPIGDISILERILNQFHKYQAEDFYITLNYKKEMIKSYFSDLKLPYKLHYIEEEEPLGTAGSIRLINKRFGSPVIVTNCDILIKADYGKILEFHRKSEYDMTIVSSLKNITIPYGVLHSGTQGLITSMEEKPQLSNFINTGMYLINPDYLEWIPEGKFFHMTDLAGMMMERGKRVGMYPISENSFLDMGEFGEMKKMEERIKGGEFK